MNRDLEHLRSVWEKAARSDPHFAVCSDPALRGTWKAEDFFASGDREVDALLAYLHRYQRVLAGPVLDFGCGLGRLTRALASRLGTVVGVDLSSSMVEQARELHASVSGCQFVVNERPDLTLFPDDHFGGVYSNIVLQHMPRALGERYIAEFIRVTRPGGIVVFQVPSRFRSRMLDRIRSAIRLRTRLRTAWGDTALADGRVEWEMNAIPESAVIACLTTAGATVEDVAWTNATDPDFNGNLRYLSQPPDLGWESRQYLALVR